MHALDGTTPDVADTASVSKQAYLVGDVTVGEQIEEISRTTTTSNGASSSSTPAPTRTPEPRRRVPLSSGPRYPHDIGFQREVVV